MHIAIIEWVPARGEFYALNERGCRDQSPTFSVDQFHSLISRQRAFSSSDTLHAVFFVSVEHWIPNCAPGLISTVKN